LPNYENIAKFLKYQQSETRRIWPYY